MADLPMDPPSIKHRCLEYHYTKLGRSAGRPTPCQSSIDAFNTATPNLADLPADLTPHQSSIDALNTATANLADLLPDLDPPPPIKHRSLENHYTTYLAEGTPNQA